MRFLTESEIEFVAGGLIKGPGDGDDPGGGAVGLPPVVVTAPDPGNGGWFPPLTAPTPSDPGASNPPPGGGGSGGHTGSDGHTHTSALAQSISDAFGTGSATVQYTDGQATGATYNWQNYQSTAGVEASENHMAAYDTVQLFNGTELKATAGLTGNSLSLSTALNGNYDGFGFGITTTNGDLSSAHLDFKDGALSLGPTWSAPDALGLHFAEDLGSVKINATLSNITSTATELNISLSYSNGVTTNMGLIHDTAASATNHGGYGITFGLTVPLN